MNLLVFYIRLVMFLCRINNSDINMKVVTVLVEMFVVVVVLTFTMYACLPSKVNYL